MPQVSIGHLSIDVLELISKHLNCHDLACLWSVLVSLRPDLKSLLSNLSCGLFLGRSLPPDSRLITGPFGPSSSRSAPTGPSALDWVERAEQMREDIVAKSNILAYNVHEKLSFGSTKVDWNGHYLVVLQRQCRTLTVTDTRSVPPRPVCQVQHLPAIDANSSGINVWQNFVILIHANFKGISVREISAENQSLRRVVSLGRENLLALHEPIRGPFSEDFVGEILERDGCGYLVLLTMRNLPELHIFNIPNLDQVEKLQLPSSLGPHLGMIFEFHVEHRPYFKPVTSFCLRAWEKSGGQSLWSILTVRIGLNRRPEANMVTLAPNEQCLVFDVLRTGNVICLTEPKDSRPVLKKFKFQAGKPKTIRAELNPAPMATQGLGEVIAHSVNTDQNDLGSFVRNQMRLSTNDEALILAVNRLDQIILLGFDPDLNELFRNVLEPNLCRRIREPKDVAHLAVNQSHFALCGLVKGCVRFFLANINTAHPLAEQEKPDTMVGSIRITDTNGLGALQYAQMTDTELHFLSYHPKIGSIIIPFN